MSGRPWTDHERELIRAQYPTRDARDIAQEIGRSPRAVWEQAAKMGIRKAAGYQSVGGHKGAHHPRAIEKRFKAGDVPWNAGIRFHAGGRSQETQFRRGDRSGRATELHKPVGYERLSKDGYIERKINDDMPLHKRWRAVHLIEWEAANGPLPAGHAVTFRDGDKRNTALDNLELVSRADLMRRNTRHNLPPEINELISLRAALVRKINNRTKDTE